MKFKLPNADSAYGIAEIAEALDTSKPYASLCATNGINGMPPADFNLACGRVWLAATIEPWLAERRASRAGETAT